MDETPPTIHAPAAAAEVASVAAASLEDSLAAILASGYAGGNGDTVCHAPGQHDEMCAPDGQVLPHWQPFIQSLRRLGGEEVERRHQEIRRLLRENGVTYHLRGDPASQHRPWELDLAPWIIAPADWDILEPGLVQRATLLDLLLKDLHGPRILIREGVLPAELVFSHPGFLRPCDQVFHRGQKQLTFYSADLCRDQGGRLMVLRDLTQSPTGSGFALENRTVLARVLPTVFRDCNVERLSHFFRAMRESLARLAPRRRDDPRVVLLTPGPDHESYFEHAYLSAYLGYTLVQGEDLTVRDGSVWLKSIGGLEPVDVIVRRVEDRLCDPLELDETSRHGVAGLLEAVRLGHVAVANPLGSGVLENAGLAAFLPAICRRLLAEELALPSPRTWWCGHKDDRGHVLEHLGSLRLVPIAPAFGRPVDGWTLTREERKALRRRIQATPHAYTAQAPVALSTAPALRDGALIPRPVVLRTFLAAREDGYIVMPGGLTRSVQAGHCAETQAGGEVSKDTWVRARARQPHVSLWSGPETQPAPWTIDNVLPSLAAENLFWVGRHAERAGCIARLLRTLVNLFTHADAYGADAQGPETERPSLAFMLQALAHASGSVLPAEVAVIAGWPEGRLQTLALDQTMAGGLDRSLRQMVANAYAVRDRWSSDTWRVIDAIDAHEKAMRALFHSDNAGQPDRDRPRAAPGANLAQIQVGLDSLLTSLMAFTGYSMESMTRAVGWMLLDAGRRIERGLMLIGVLQHVLTPRHDPLVSQQLLEMTLTTLESLITYRRRYRSQLRLEQALDLLLLDESNPRALAFQLEQLRQHMQALPRPRRQTRTSPEERLTLEAYAGLKRMDATDLARPSPRTQRHETLRTFLAEQARLLAALSEAVTLAYFSHVGGPQQLARRQEPRS